MFTGYYNDEATTSERLRDGKYWSGDLWLPRRRRVDLSGRAHRRLDAGRRGEHDGRADRADPAADARDRQVVVYGVPDETVGDAVMAAVVPSGTGELSPEAFAGFLAEQSDLSPKAWPRYVRIAARSCRRPRPTRL